MFKTETHLHTCEVSSCSKLHASELIKLYKEAGYSTVFVSDHFQKRTLDTFGDLPWTHKVSIFVAGYNRARLAGEKFGVNVLFAAEFCFPDDKNHYLAYGVTREFLDAHPDLDNMSAEEFFRIAHEEGIFIVHAHPYRDACRAPKPELVDAIEIYNSNPRHENNTPLAEALADNTGLPITAGSDTHRPEDVALTGIITETEIKTVEDYIRAVKSGSLKIIRNEDGV